MFIKPHSNDEVTLSTSTCLEKFYEKIPFAETTLITRREKCQPLANTVDKARINIPEMCE